MGQSFRTIVKRSHGRVMVYNRCIVRDGKPCYAYAKLTEHSRWLNEFVNAVCSDIYTDSEYCRVAWVGDYADFCTESLNGLNVKQINRLYRQAWNRKGSAVQSTDFTLCGKYLINKTKHEYIDCSAYYANSVMRDGKCMHPLPILTCIGNGLGSGDYNSPTKDSTTGLIGSWAWDEICITDKPVKGYAEIKAIFKEKGRNEQ